MISKCEQKSQDQQMISEHECWMQVLKTGIVSADVEYNVGNVSVMDQVGYW